MSSSMLSPISPAYRFDPPKAGILLNAIRPQQSIPKSPSSTSYTTPSSPSSSDSASGSDDPAPKAQSNRRITFAPLPNPRAQDDVPVIVFDHTSDKLYENPEAANSSSGDDNPAVILDPTTRSPQLGAKKPSTWSHSTKKLLKPFYKPLQKSDVADGGALGLFRSSSRDSTASSVGTLNDLGTPLARRMSTGSSPFDTNQDRSGLALHPVTSENGGVATGTRMLNGRVYGGSRYRTAVQKKEVEKDPEFVEWGYGGMGSNRGSGASSTYAKVQSSHTNAVAAEDEDDGSGMGWVRKRREAREQEKREREEREAKEREAAAAAAGGAAPAPTAAETANTAAAGDAQSANPTQDDSSTTAQSDPVSPPTDAPEHITQAVHIPFGHHHHHHAKPSPSRRSSDMASGGNTPIIKPNNDSTPTVTSIPHSTAPTVGSSLWMSATPEQAQSSEDSESDEESTEREDEAREDDDEDEDEDEDEESEDDANLRKTSVCAGVEKISRHKE